MRVVLLSVVAACRDLTSLLRDERGAYSSARCALWLTLAVTLWLIAAAAFGRAALSPAAYSLLGTMVLAFASWAGGPRVAQYLSTWAGKAVESLGKAKGDERWPDIRRDDERGEG